MTDDTPTRFEFEPVIIIGAARSGTRLVRSLIAATGCYREVPFDVNYIWRYGNESCRNDVLLARGLTQKIRRFIRAQLPRCARGPAQFDSSRGRRSRGPGLPFVEKTVSNVLRLPFVKAVYPDAKFVAIVRDGRDVAESATRCWREPPRAGQLLAKLATFPWRRCAPYAWKYGVDVARRQLGIDRYLRTWGPRYPGIDDDRNRFSLLEVCARQWVASIEYYEQSRHLFAAHELLELRYEELVGDTSRQVYRLCDFLHVENRDDVLQFAQQTVRVDRAVCQRAAADDNERRTWELMQQVLERWGYVGKQVCAA